MNFTKPLELAAATLLTIASAAALGQNAISVPASTFDVGHGFSATFERTLYTSRHDSLNRYNGSEVTSLSLHRKFGAGTFHYGNTYAPSERHQHVGFSTKRITGAYFQGSGESFSKAGSGLYQDLNHYFFHGGSRAPFRFQGGGLDVEMGNGLSAQVAGIRINSPGLEDRSGHYAGISAGRLSGGIFGMDRGGEGVGQGFNLAFDGVRAGFEYQEVHSDTGAHLRRVGFSWRSNPVTRLSLELEDAGNPLYAAADERRVMFRFQRSFGPGTSFTAAEQQGESSEEGGNQGKDENKYVKVVAIGLGVGALAAAVSSGDGGSDESQRFASADEAAFDVLNGINPTSVQENREHGGWVYRQADGSFNSTTPIAGDVASVNIGNPVTAVPIGTQAAASYHTHGGPDPRYDNENFSPQDILSDVLAGVDGYLGTPAGFLKKHDLNANQVYVLGRIAN